MAITISGDIVYDSLFNLTLDVYQNDEIKNDMAIVYLFY